MPRISIELSPEQVASVEKIITARFDEAKTPDECLLLMCTGADMGLSLAFWHTLKVKFDERYCKK